jgi:hypothetical protein
MTTYVELLREDCFAGLKQGIQDFIANKPYDFSEIKFYKFSVIGFDSASMSLAIKVDPLGLKKNT